MNTHKDPEPDTTKQSALVFDLDGTLYSGDQIFERWAEYMQEGMLSSNRSVFATTVADHLISRGTARFDNWEAMVNLAEPWVVDHRVWEMAFWNTRRDVLVGKIPLDVPVGLPGFLESLKERAVVVLVTNSPPKAAGPLLDRLGIFSCFDQVVTDARKPQGLIDVGQTYFPHVPVQRRLSIGDSYRHDIEPAVRQGWLTGHVSPREVFIGPSTWRARRIDELMDVIRQFVDHNDEI